MVADARGPSGLVRAVVIGVLCAAVVGCTPGASGDTEPVVLPHIVTSSASPSPASTVAPSPAAQQSPGEAWQQADMSAAIPLVNKEHRLPASYAPASTGRYGLTADANAAIGKLIAAATADGVPMVVRSGYRSYAAQDEAYRSALRTYSSPAEAMRYNAPPGASEHQTGLALDMWDGKNRGTAFRGTATDKWLAANAYKFGFIIRYPKGKEAITGYMDEPWHLRYVGVQVAAHFGPHNTLTLEEYLASR